MRFYLKTGTLAVVLAGVGLFLAARYGARHPHSFAGRCAATVYHMWDPMFAPATAEAPAAPEDRANEAKAPGLVRANPSAEPIEPIVLEPTDQEPPLATPSLSPEIAAAIERLRAEEESEAPPKAFANPSQTLRMPYADEDVDLPIILGVARALGASNPCGALLIPPIGWQEMLAHPQ